MINKLAKHLCKVCVHRENRERQALAAVEEAKKVAQLRRGVVHMRRFGTVEPPRTAHQLPRASELCLFQDIGATTIIDQLISCELPLSYHVSIDKFLLVMNVTGETRCAGCLCTCSGWFKHIEPRRTFLNHIITDIAKCVEFCHMSSGWFDHTEPSLSGVQGAYALVTHLAISVTM